MELKLIVIAFFLCTVFIRALYYGVVYGAPIRLARRARKGKLQYAKHQEAVSVIIYSKYGYEDIKAVLPQLCGQDYPTYEVIFVLNERHKPAKLVEEQLKKTYPNLYFTYYPDEARVQSRYKLALIIGLKAAKNNCILLTQSHCVPTSDQWIARMARNRVDGIDIIIGITRYIDTKKSCRSLDAWIGNLLRIRSYAMASLRKPYMAWGSNLMFSKSLYLQEDHIKSNLRLRHGEDDLFVNMTAKAQNTRIEIDPESLVEADVRDKKWITHQLPSIYLDTQRHYGGTKHLLFRLEQIVNSLFLISFLVCGYIFYNDYWGIALFSVAILSIVAELLIIRSNTQIVHQTNYVFRGLLYRIIAPIIFQIQGKYKHKRTRYE